MGSTTSGRRRKPRSTSEAPHVLRIRADDGRGQSRWITADLLDYSPVGIGIALATPLAVGIPVTVTGRLQAGRSARSETCPAHVAWCLEKSDGSFRAGLQFGRPPEHEREWQSAASESAPEPEDAEDYYEILQVSPHAHPDTIHRVFKLLAQRFHPDNKATGNEEVFKRILAAYRVLRDPELRASYDGRRESHLRARWRIFDEPATALGVEAEKRKRKGILGVLYAQMLHDPDHPGLGIQELEDLLGCPRDHLQLSLWYLKERGQIARSDRGRYSITVDGVDTAEAEAAYRPALHRLLESGR